MTNKLDIKRVGFATGATFALAYAGCVVVMLTVPHDVTLRFFNSLMHGVDLGPIVKWDVPVVDTIVGCAQTFLLGWLFGALWAALYNLDWKRSGAPAGESDARS